MGICEDTEISELPKQGPAKAERTGWLRYLGLFLGFASCASFSLSLAIVKAVGDTIGPASMGVYRFTGVSMSLPFLLFFLYKDSKSIWPFSHNHKDNIKISIILLSRGLCGCTSSALQFFAVTYISLPSAMTITYSTPILVGRAWIFFGEKCGIFSAFTAILTLAGVVTTGCVGPAQSTGDEQTFHDQLIGGSMAFSAMILQTGVFIMLRYLRRVHFTVVTTVFGFVGLIQSVIMCLILNQFDVPQSSWEWVLVSAVGLLTLIGQFFMTASLKFEDAGPISIVKTTEVVFAFVWQYVFFGIEPDLYTSLGGLIVCVGVGLTACKKYVTNLDPSDPLRKRLVFVLH